MLSLIRPDNPWLAPMAGHTDLPFRLLCREYGCEVACTEMVSVKGLLYNSPETFRILQTHQKDQPLVVQIFGSDKDLIKEALQILLAMGYSMFDLNAGCSVKKVVKSGAGAALLQTPDKLSDIVKTMVDISGGNQIGVKLRSGWYSNDHTLSLLAPKLEQSGLAWITLHPRTVAQGFSGQANWSHLKQLKKIVRIPVIGSGDIFTVNNAVHCLEWTGIDGIMFARGALKNPLIFRDFKRKWSQGLPCSQGHTPEELISIMQRHIQLSLKCDPSRKRFFKMRASLARYVRGIDEAKELRKTIMTCNRWEELESFLSNYLNKR